MEHILSPPASPESDGDEDETITNTEKNIDTDKECQRIMGNLATIKNTGGEVEANSIKFLSENATSGARRPRRDEGGEQDELIGDLTRIVLYLHDLENRKRGNMEPSKRNKILEEERIVFCTMHSTVKQYVSMVHKKGQMSQASSNIRSDANSLENRLKSLDSQQQRALEEFFEYTTLDTEVAIDVLENCGWDVNTAIMMQFNDDKHEVTHPTASGTADAFESSTLVSSKKRKQPMSFTHDPWKGSSNSQKKQKLSEAEEEAATRAARSRFEALLQENNKANEDIKVADEVKGIEDSDVVTAGIDSTAQLSSAQLVLDNAKKTLKELQNCGLDSNNSHYVSLPYKFCAR